MAGVVRPRNLRSVGVCSCGRACVVVWAEGGGRQVVWHKGPAGEGWRVGTQAVQAEKQEVSMW